MTDALLVEIFTEELPPKALPRLANAFADGVFDGLVRVQLKQRDPRGIRRFATPRRLGVLVPGVLRNAADRHEEKKLMPAKVAFDHDGKPTTALLRRLDKEGESADSVESLKRRNDAGTEQVFLSRIVPGAELGSTLQDVLDEAVARLPIPKVMRYQTEGEDVEFIRPAHGLVALYGSEIVPVKVLQLEATRITHGHRFQGARSITLAHAEEYESKLRKEGGVIASFDERREEIRRQLIEQASSLTADLRLDERAELLDEVTALVEFPTVYVGEFEREFLAVPQECLILTMQQNQKYFPLFDGDGRLLNRFLIVSNMRLDDPTNIVQGNQRVVRPRLADARFFFETDRKTRLADRVPQLAGIVYHNKLGSQLERIERLRKLARTIAERTGTDTALADRAALLCKADLLTGMVGEFPELQGIMGRYYALHDGEDPRVADAIEAHYRPRFSGDTLPATGASTAVALADKLDALVGMFGIGLAPTGEKDPFGLRRQAMAAIRTLAEHGLPLDLVELLNAARELFPSKLLPSSVVDEVYLFILDRLRSYLREREYQPDEIEAVLSQVPSRIALVLPRLKAVQGFKKLPEAEALASANKRIQNILRKSEIAGDMIQPKLFREAEEIDLYELMVELDGRVEPLVESGNYDEALKALASLRRPVDTFFDRVLVNADDMRIRANRHGLLLHLSALMNQVADISKLARGEA